VGGAGRGLDQGGIDIAEVVDLEDLGLRVGAVLGEAAGQVDAVAGPLGRVSIKPGAELTLGWLGGRAAEQGTYVLTKQALAAAAVEAVTAQFRVVCRDAVAELEVRHFGAHGDHHTDGFMARDERELGDELALVDVLGIPC
jgi:hypothetical protein